MWLREWKKSKRKNREQIHVNFRKHFQSTKHKSTLAETGLNYAQDQDKV
jgi:hypothetical protein